MSLSKPRHANTFGYLALNFSEGNNHTYYKLFPCIEYFAHAINPECISYMISTYSNKHLTTSLMTDHKPESWNSWGTCLGTHNNQWLSRDIHLGSQSVAPSILTSVPDSTFANPQTQGPPAPRLSEFEGRWRDGYQAYCSPLSTQSSTFSQSEMTTKALAQHLYPMQSKRPFKALNAELEVLSWPWSCLCLCKELEGVVVRVG